MKQTSLPVETYNTGKDESSITSDSNSKTKRSNASEKTADMSSVVSLKSDNSIPHQTTSDTQNITENDIKPETQVNVQVEETSFDEISTHNIIGDSSENSIECEKELADTDSNETFESKEITSNNNVECEKVVALSVGLTENLPIGEISEHDKSTLCSESKESSDNVPTSNSADLPPTSCSEREASSTVENDEKTSAKDFSNDGNDPENLLNKEDENQPSSGN